MKNIVFAGSSYRLRLQSRLTPISYPCLQISRAASLNSAIGRGLRRSKGVGFRGKERSQDGRNAGFDGGARGRELPIRRSADPPAVQSQMTRDGWRAENPMARSSSTGGSGTMNSRPRMRRGKVDVKDDRGPPPRRSRAARFNDPNHSFGNKSFEKRQNMSSPIEQYKEGGLSIRKSSLRNDDEKAGGRRRPQISSSARRAADSDRTALLRNPDGTKISKSRLAYLSRTGSSPKSRDVEQAHERTSSRPAQEDREPRRFERESPRYARMEDQEPRRVEGERPRFSRGEDQEPRRSEGERSRFSSGEDQEPRRFEGERSRFSREQDQMSRNNNFDRDNRDGRSTFTKTRDDRLPLSIPYTTPASEFLYGTSVVEAALRSYRNPRRKLYKLYIYSGENRENAERDVVTERLAKKNGVEIVRVDTNWLRVMDKMSGGRPHNGYILEASPLPRLPVTSLGESTTRGGEIGFTANMDHQSREEAAINGTSNFVPVPDNQQGRKPFVLLLDSILDPGNLGGIIRTASFLGVTAIAISTRNSASFTPVVLKASAGASENITLFSVNKPAGFVVDSKVAGWKVYAAVAPSGKQDSSATPSITTDDLYNPLEDSPCILMLGNEGEGLRWNLRSKADVELAIQGSGQRGSVDSLNVSVATGILCNAFLRRHDHSSSPKTIYSSESMRTVRDLF